VILNTTISQYHGNITVSEESAECALKQNSNPNKQNKLLTQIF
jgi:hypothetical protein